MASGNVFPENCDVTYRNLRVFIFSFFNELWIIFSIKHYLCLNHHSSSQKLERLSKKKLSQDLIQFPKKTNRLNLKLSVVLEII